MGKGIKYLGFAGAGVVALLVAGVVIIASVDVNEYKPLISEKAREALGRELVLTGDAEMQVSLTPRVSIGGARLANAPWAEAPDMVTVGNFALELELLPILFGDIRVRELILEDVLVSLEKDADGRANWIMGGDITSTQSPPSEPGGATLPTVNNAQMRNVTVRYRDGETDASYEVTLTEVNASADSLDSPLSVAAKGQVNGAAFDFQTEIGSLLVIADSSGTTPITVRANALATTANFDGNARFGDGAVAGLDGGLDVRSEDAAATFEELGKVVPTLDLAALPAISDFSVRGDLSFADSSIGLTGLALRFGTSDLTGNVSVQLSAIPQVTARILSEQVNVVELMPVSEDGAPSADQGAGDGRLFPDTPLQLSALQTVEVDAEIKAGVVTLPGATIENLATTITLRDGGLSVSPMSADFYDGRFDGRLGLAAKQSPARLEVEGTLGGIDYGKLLQARGMEGLVSGTVDGRFSLSGAGQSVRELMAGLNGDLFFATEGARIDSGAVGLLGGDVLSALPGFGAADANVIKCGVVNFDVQDGIANAKAIVAETPVLSAIGGGRVDLRQETLNLLIDPRAKKASLASAAIVPVSVVGTLASPEVTVDAGALAVGAAGTAAKGAAAIATMGLSLLAESVAKRAVNAVDTSDYCTPALAGQVVTASDMSASDPRTSDQSGSQNAPPPQEQGGPGKVLEGVSDGLRSLFGN